MKTPSEFCLETFSLAAEEEAHQACRRYEQALHDGDPLSIVAVLSEIQLPHRPLALYELVKTDVEFRQNRGEEPTASDYAIQIECPHVASAVLTALQDSAPTALQASTEVRGASPTEPSTDRAVTSPDASQRTIPQELGRYSIAERLGRGGMGTVFKAFDSRLKRFVALKVPHFELAGDVSIRERFRREALALAALHHDMIVAVYDVERSGDHEFMTMALIEGETLRCYIHEGQPLAEHQAAILIRALAKAMQYVHGSGVIHRDLKPENVIMEDGRKPVIVDFGLARSPGASELPTTTVSAELGRHVTRFGQVAGTPEYSSPEQLAGDFDAVGPQTDIYSLGVILFELLTGRLPWDSDDPAVGPEHAGEMGIEIQACDLNPQVDHRLAAVCAKAMDSNQAHRYRTMTDFAEALKPFCQVSHQLSAGSERADKNSDENINAVLQEIARQAAPKFSRPAETSVEKKRPVAIMAIIIIALGGAGLLVNAWLDRQDDIASAANSLTESGKLRTRRAFRPSSVRRDRAPDEVPFGNWKAASSKEPTANNTTARPNASEPQQPEPQQPEPQQRETQQPEPEQPQPQPQPPSPTPTPAPQPQEIKAIPRREADETPAPAWRSATQRIIEAGGMIVFKIPADDNVWHEKQVRKVSEIPKQSASQIVAVVLKRPSAHPDYATELRQLLEDFSATLRSLELTGVPLDEATIAVVAQLRQLRQLVLRDVGLSRADWEDLSGGSFSMLRRIDLGANQIDPAALDLMLTAWERTAAPLESIGLAGAIGIGRQEMERIAQFPTLLQLDLTDAAVEPAALVKLSEANGLAELILAGVSLPDESARFLVPLRYLERVDLSRTDLSDAALTDLVRAGQNLSRLQSIDVRETRLSSAGVLTMASRLGKRDVAVTIVAGNRLDFAYRKGTRRESALKHFQAGPRVEPAVAAGIDWLLRNQAEDGLWSLRGPYPNGAAEENQAEATALALLVLQGHGYDGLGKDRFHNAVRNGYRGLNTLVQNAGESSDLGPYGNALASLAVCDLHAMAGFRLQQNSRLPQQPTVDFILKRCRELQGNDGGWGEKDRSNALLTGWYIQALSSAEAAGFRVDPDMLVGAKKFLEKLWRADIKRYIYQDRDRRNHILASHGSTVTSLHLIDRMPTKRAEGLFRDKHEEAAQDPYFCYYGTRAAISAGGDLWQLWNRNPLAEKLLVDQTSAGTERGSWFPSNVSDDKGRGCKHACGRFYATCLNLLALEAYYRHLPWVAPVEWRTIDTTNAAQKTRPAAG